MDKWREIAEKVKEFYIAFGQEEYLKRGTMSLSRARLRYSLLKEEYTEYKEAVRTKDRVKILDALCDMAYIKLGTMLELSGGDTGKVAERIYFHDDRTFGAIWRKVNEQGFREVFFDAFAEVHRSNMSKLDENGNAIFRKDGKILKGPNFSEPDLKKFVKEENKWQQQSR